MDANDWMFEPPALDLARINARLARLPSPLPELIQRAGDALVADDLRTAQAVLGRALSLAPHQPDVLRLYALLLSQVGNLPASGLNFEAAIEADPGEAMGYWQYAQVCERVGNLGGALELRELAARRLPESPLALMDLGNHYLRDHQAERALPVLEQVVRLAPDYAPAQLRLGDALVACGRVAEGAASVRKAIAADPSSGAAWIDLVNIKTAPATDSEVRQMCDVLGGARLADRDRTTIEFALAQVYEDRGRYADAYALLVDANARHKRMLAGWDANRFEEQVALSRQVFAEVRVATADPCLGDQVIFIVGMPRSGTTLVEQILASHAEVSGAGELGELAQVLAEESRHRQLRYPEWVPLATTEDWGRLGRRYLDLTERYRAGKPRMTDKMPNNWQALGAIRAMLPGARIVICRRDPLENCWSCFKQFFVEGWPFTYDMDQLAIFWRGFETSASWWAGREPAHVRQQGYESLTEEPETQIRALLDFCRLSFDPACLAFHQTHRNIHTLSAGQVREPMRRHSDLAAAYGALLDPLRKALGASAMAAAKTVQAGASRAPRPDGIVTN